MLSGGSGKDVLVGKGGKDVFPGGRHSDSIRAKDGKADTIYIVGGWDQISMDDGLDTVIKK